MWTTGPDQILGLLGGSADPEWTRVGIDVVSSRMWQILGVPPETARRLSDDGIDAETSIRKWWAAGVPLAEVADWLAAGLTPEEAVSHRAAGIGLDQARAFAALRGVVATD